MKRSLFALLAMTAAASAASVYENQNLLESKVDSINAKRGVEFGGAIRGVAEASYFSTDQDPFGMNKMPDVEKDEFVTGDLDFHFRPFENVRANAMMRLEAGMQEYFASAAKSISVEWINVEGNVGKSFYWIVGDFRQQYSPLTLFLPSLDIMYEPMVFARQRHMAEKSQLIEGNQRNLQGVNLQFRQDLGETLGEVRVEGLFSRLNRTAVLDVTGAEGNIFPDAGEDGVSLASNMDKWLGAANLELLPMGKNLYVGATGMYIFDNEDSYSYTYRHPDNSIDEPYVRTDINPNDVNPQKTSVISARLGADVAGLLNNSNLVLDVTAEMAFSNDKVYSMGMKNVIDSVTKLPVIGADGLPVQEEAVLDDDLSGMAILANLNAGFKTDAWSLKLQGDIVYNDSGWFNNLAQSPRFFAQRVLNSDIDGNTVRYAVNSPLYSTFDALYSFTPKFSPVSRVLGTDDNALRDGQTSSYNTANYNKNSWTTNVYNRRQLAALQALSDPALQLALPNGLATSNRVGGRGTLLFGYGDFAEAQGMVGVFSQVSPLLGFDKVSYMEFGGGLKVDVFKAIGFSRPLELSGSYKHSESTCDLDPAVTQVAGTGELKSDFINAGFYVQYLPRLGFTAGLQYITTEYNDVQATLTGLLVPMMKGKQMQWMVGLDYNIEKNAWLALNIGRISVANEYNTSNYVDKYAADGKAPAAGVADGVYNLPVYYDVSKETPRTSEHELRTFKHEFSQMILEASLNVEF